MNDIAQTRHPRKHNPLFYIKYIAASLLFLAVTATLASAACQVTLQWNPNSDGRTEGYRLFCRQAQHPYDYQAPVYDGSADQCTIDDLEEGVTYYFVVRAYDDQGNMSGDSNEVRFFFDIVPPEAPDLLNPEDGSVSVEPQPLLATGPFFDADASDYHTRTQWQIFRAQDDLTIFTLSSTVFTTDFQLPPLVLDGATTYSWTG